MAKGFTTGLPIIIVLSGFVDCRPQNTYLLINVHNQVNKNGAEGVMGEVVDADKKMTPITPGKRGMSRTSTKSRALRGCRLFVCPPPCGPWGCGRSFWPGFYRSMNSKARSMNTDAVGNGTMVARGRFLGGLGAMLGPVIQAAIQGAIMSGAQALSGQIGGGGGGGDGGGGG